jgi:hypothetical protein
MDTMLAFSAQGVEAEVLVNGGNKLQISGTKLI